MKPKSRSSLNVKNDLEILHYFNASFEYSPARFCFIVYNVFTPTRNARGISIHRNDKAHKNMHDLEYILRGNGKKVYPWWH